MGQHKFWVVRRTDTGEDLGVTGYLGLDKRAEFGARQPLLFSSTRAAMQQWRAYAVEAGYLTRGVTLPGVSPWHWGWNASAMPPVAIIPVTLTDVPDGEKILGRFDDA